MGLNLYKEVTMNLQLTNQHHGFEENNSSATNAPRPLATVSYTHLTLPTILLV